VVFDKKFEDDERDRADRGPPSPTPSTDSNVSDDLSAEAADDSKKHKARPTERFMSTMSRGTLDVNNPDMLRRAFLLRRGQGACSHWALLADPTHGFKFYKNTNTYMFQWEKPKDWDSEDAKAARPPLKVSRTRSADPPTPSLPSPPSPPSPLSPNLPRRSQSFPRPSPTPPQPLPSRPRRRSSRG
jgi:hypothetical protein